jgi:PleD family two-component response regulator
MRTMALAGSHVVSLKEKGSLPENTGGPASMETAGSQARVLVVDEQAQSRMAIDGMLKRAEYATVLSSDGDEAIAHL